MRHNMKRNNRIIFNFKINTYRFQMFDRGPVLNFEYLKIKIPNFMKMIEEKLHR